MTRRLSPETRCAENARMLTRARLARTPRIVQSATLRGEIRCVTFHNADNFYTVARVRVAAADVASLPVGATAVPGGGEGSKYGKYKKRGRGGKGGRVGARGDGDGGWAHPRAPPRAPTC